MDDMEHPFPIDRLRSFQEVVVPDELAAGERPCSLAEAHLTLQSEREVVGVANEGEGGRGKGEG